MTIRRPIVPPPMRAIVDRAGYLPAVQAGSLVFCAGQVGRSDDLDVILEPRRQFEACWRNVRLVLEEAGCTFADVVDLTTYHVGLSTHIATFREIKDLVFPRGTCAWTCIGVAELAAPGLLVEIKCVALRSSEG